MKKLIIWIFLLFAFFVSNFALSGNNFLVDFKKGNDAYRKGQWDRAAELYRLAAQGGMNNAELWYNAGCAEWKNNSKSRALLYFQRACRITPRDPDLRKNMEIVQEQLGDNSKHRERIFTSILTVFSLNELLWALLFLVWGFFILLFIYYKFKKEIMAWMAGIFLLFMLILGISSGLLVYQQVKTPAAIVLADEAEVFTGPGRDYTNSGKLQGGSLVLVLSNQDNWSEISIRTGFQGWIRNEELEKI